MRESSELVVWYFQCIMETLKAKSAVIKKINKSIMTDYKNTFEYKRNLFNYLRV